MGTVAKQPCLEAFVAEFNTLEVSDIAAKSLAMPVTCGKKPTYN